MDGDQYGRMGSDAKRRRGRLTVQESRQRILNFHATRAGSESGKDIFDKSQ
jgi:hypothetical protein